MLMSQDRCRDTWRCGATVTRLFVLSSLTVLAAAGCSARAGQADPPPQVRASSASVKELAPADSVQRLEISFGIGYLALIGRYDTALSRIAADGFRVIRVYEPFTHRLSPEYSDVVEDLKHLTARGLTPYLSLSNFPYSLEPGPGSPQQRDDSLPRGRRATVLSYSNRFPPRNLAAYGRMVGGMTAALERAFGRNAVESWYFEIGNEPDAPLYFWGNAADFEQVYRTATDAILGSDSSLDVGGAAYTSGLVADPALHPAFAGASRDLARLPGTRFFSFHLYDNQFSGAAPNARRVLDFVPAHLPLVVSEWNVSSVPNHRVSQILDSGAFVPYLIGIVQLCHQVGVRLLLLHKLMDDPPATRDQLGIFRADGTPKQAYTYIRFMNRLTSAGYTVSDMSGLVEIRSARRMAVLARTGDHRLDMAGWNVDAASRGFERQTRRLPEGGWVLLSHPAP